MSELERQIETHFEMLMPIETQQRLGVDNNQSRDMQLRVMRVIAHCSDIEKRLIDREVEIEWLKKENAELRGIHNKTIETLSGNICMETEK